ncbi:MAG TPA: hypothetical protein VII06_39925 [Chloroflexota bacterium]
MSAGKQSPDSEPADAAATREAGGSPRDWQQGTAKVPRDAEVPDAEELDVDEVTEASMESFPASDPPGWVREEL